MERARGYAADEMAWKTTGNISFQNILLLSLSSFQFNAFVSFSRSEHPLSKSSFQFLAFLCLVYSKLLLLSISTSMKQMSPTFFSHHFLLNSSNVFSLVSPPYPLGLFIAISPPRSPFIQKIKKKQTNNNVDCMRLKTTQNTASIRKLSSTIRYKTIQVYCVWTYLIFAAA